MTRMLVWLSIAILGLVIIAAVIADITDPNPSPPHGMDSVPR